MIIDFKRARDVFGITIIAIMIIIAIVCVIVIIIIIYWIIIFRIFLREQGMEQKNLLIRNKERKVKFPRNHGNMGDFFASHTVAMVTYCATKIITTWSPVTRQLFDTMIVA